MLGYVLSLIRRAFVVSPRMVHVSLHEARLPRMVGHQRRSASVRKSEPPYNLNALRQHKPTTPQDAMPKVAFTYGDKSVSIVQLEKLEHLAGARGRGIELLHSISSRLISTSTIHLISKVLCTSCSHRSFVTDLSGTVHAKIVNSRSEWQQE